MFLLHMRNSGPYFKYGKLLAVIPVAPNVDGGASVAKTLTALHWTDDSYYYYFNLYQYYED